MPDRYKGIVYTHTVEAGNTVNETYYSLVLQKLWSHVQRKRSHWK